MKRIEIQEEYIRAGSPDTSVKELRNLAKSSIVAVRRRVAENERTPSDVLEALSRDPKPEVRIAVGLGHCTSADILARLVHDEHDDVRYWLASAGYLPRKLLEGLSIDSNPYVAARAKRTLARLSRPVGRLINVFELLSQDHGLILQKLEAVTRNHSEWARDTLSAKISELLDDIRQHLERRHTLCARWFGEQSGLPDNITKQCLVDQESIIDQTSWFLAHGIAEPDFARHLTELLEQIRNHREFIENVLFVEIRKHVSQEEIDAIDLRLNGAAA